MYIEPAGRPGRGSRPKGREGARPLTFFSRTSIGLRAETTAASARRQSFSAQRQLHVGAEPGAAREARTPRANRLKRRPLDRRNLEPAMRGRSDGDVAHREG